MPRAVALLFAAGLACAAARPPARTPALLGRPVELALSDMTGRRVDVAADEGKVRIVDFWASWCEPCREALPFLDSLRREQGERGLSVYAVTVDEDPSQIRAFLEQVPVGFPVLWDKGGMRYADTFEIQRLPTTYVIDRKGIVRFVHEEYDEAVARETREQVERLLTER
jgi:thiol-disulfide isomerase/thioredoxin